MHGGVYAMFLFVYDILFICDSLFVDITVYININPIDMQQLLYMYQSSLCFNY